MLISESVVELGHTLFSLTNQVTRGRRPCRRFSMIVREPAASGYEPEVDQ